MAFPKLGRLTSVSAKSVWQFEAQSFTPWLANNLDILADALELGELELRATEVPVGEFRLDILATDESDSPVLIENQFGSTDHRHLGQLITYAAAQRGKVTAIWIAESIREDHRAAIDWLNSATTEEFSFFGIEVSAVRIGESDPAPFFRVVARPNDWVKAVEETTNNANLSESHRIRLAYWATFSTYLSANDSSFVIRRQNKDHWHAFSIGRAGFDLSATLSTKLKRVGVELYRHNDPSKAGFHQLAAHRGQIEAEFGEALEWQELPTKKAWRIVLFNPIDPAQEENWPSIQLWMLDKMQRFKRVFAERLRRLDLEPDVPVEGD